MSAEPITVLPAPEPGGTPIAPYRPAPLMRPRPVPVEASPRDREDTRPRPRAARPVDPDTWARAVVIALAEVLMGARPAQQLNRWLEPDLYARVARRAGLAVRLGGRPTNPARAHVIGLRLSEPVPDEHEVSAAVHDGERVRAVALRMRRVGGRWHVVDAEVG